MKADMDRDSGMKRRLDRHQFIIDYLKQYKSVEVSFLSSEFNVSEVTVRKDLVKLERDKLVVRTHGGAVLNETLFLEPSFIEKEDRLTEEKAAIAAEAAKFVVPGMIIGLCTGTSISHLVKQLKTCKPLTVVTNAVNVAADLMGLAGIDVFLTGGHVRPNTFALVGETAEKAIEGLYMDYVFFGVNGFSIAHGLTAPNMEEGRVVRKMIDKARHVVVLADHSKFDKVAFYRMVSVDQVHTVITDRKTPEELLGTMREKGIQVIVV